MGLAEIFALALALGTDCFSVCLSLALERGRPKRTLLLSVLFGGLQGALVALGYQVAAGIRWLLHSDWIGEALTAWLPFADTPEELRQTLHWTLSALGATVLMAIGVSLISEWLSGSHPGEGRLVRGRLGLLLVGVTVNIDAFTAGVGLGMLDGILLALVVGVMSVVGGSMCRLGFEAGTKVGRRIGWIAQPLGGGLIILVALKAVVGLITL